MSVLKKIRNSLCLTLLFVLLCGCTAKNSVPEESVTLSETSETSGDDYQYLLVRGWTGKEMLSSIFYRGEYHTLPLVPGENEDFTISDSKMIFPDGSYAYAYTDADGTVTAMTFERRSAPSDFSIYGVGFDSVPDDIPQKIGIANEVDGDREGNITYSFYGGGIGELTFVYTDKQLMSVYISA